MRPNNEMKPTSHRQDGGSRLISVLCRHLENETMGVSLQIVGA